MSEEQFVGLGEELPPIRLPDLDGNPHSLSDHRGEKLLVFMWASW